MNGQWHELIQRYIAGVTTEAEAMSLQQALKTDAGLRALYLDYLNLDVTLEAKAEAAEMFPDAAPPSITLSRPRFQMRPMLAAAAGIVVGVFCTSVVFAYVAPLAGKAVQLLLESFESGPAPLATGVPVEVGRWSGDHTEIAGEFQGVKPASGIQMLRFLRADYVGKASADGYVADVHQLIDLRPYRHEYADGGAVLQLSAEFNAVAFPADEAYPCLMSIHALDEAMVENGEMNERQELNAEALAMTRSNRHMLDRDPATWQRQTAELRLPPDTEYLLIHIGVSHATKSQRRPVFDGHCVDDVRLVLTRRAPLP